MGHPQYTVSILHVSATIFGHHQAVRIQSVTLNYLCYSTSIDHCLLLGEDYFVYNAGF
jgi:hypothetical protein